MYSLENCHEDHEDCNRAARQYPHESWRDLATEPFSICRYILKSPPHFSIANGTTTALRMQVRYTITCVPRACQVQEFVSIKSVGTSYWLQPPANSRLHMPSGKEVLSTCTSHDSPRHPRFLSTSSSTTALARLPNTVPNHLSTEVICDKRSPLKVQLTRGQQRRF
jgi:hypothetical protein